MDGLKAPLMFLSGSWWLHHSPYRCRQHLPPRYPPHSPSNHDIIPDIKVIKPVILLLFGLDELVWVVNGSPIVWADSLSSISPSHRCWWITSPMTLTEMLYFNLLGQVLASLEINILLWPAGVLSLFFLVGGDSYRANEALINIVNNYNLRKNHSSNIFL